MKKQWVDGPFPLIETPRYKISIHGEAQTSAAASATEMCHAHNIFIRGLNSIRIQAPFISTDKDVYDFAEYVLAFCLSLHEHHNTEEVLYFPSIEDATGAEGIMEKNVVQHDEFMPKVHDFNVYISQVHLGVRKYDANKFLRLLDAFAPLLVQHLTAEIDTLLDLGSYGIDWEPIKHRMVKHAVETAERYREIPFLLHNMDVTFEGGLHKDNWPPFGWFPHLIFRWMYVPKFKGAWRFGSCDVYGYPRELTFAPVK